MESTLQAAGLGCRQDYFQNPDHRLLDGHSALLSADELHGLRGTALAAGSRGVHPPRLPRLLSRGALRSGPSCSEWC